LERTIPKMITLRQKLTPELPRVVGDGAQLSQVLMNLAANARDAMPEGGTMSFATSRIAVKAEDEDRDPRLPPGDFALLTVADTGKGMDPRTLQHIFEPFFTTKEVGKGTGLGLAMTYGVVKSCEGHIFCQSSPGSGTVFSIYLPVFGGEAGVTLPEATPASSGEAEPFAQKGETILLVDDEEWIREAGSVGLSKLGYRIVTAKSGEEALEWLERDRENIHAVILDLGMPGMGGRKCLHLIHQRWPDLKIVVASGYGMDFQAKGVLENGAVDFIPKPYRIRELAQRIRRLSDPPEYEAE